MLDLLRPWVQWTPNIWPPCLVSINSSTLEKKSSTTFSPGNCVKQGLFCKLFCGSLYESSLCMFVYYMLYEPALLRQLWAWHGGYLVREHQLKSSTWKNQDQDLIKMANIQAIVIERLGLPGFWWKKRTHLSVWVRSIIMASSGQAFTRSSIPQFLKIYLLS